MFELAISQQHNPTRQLLGIYFPIINVLFVSERHQIAVYLILIGVGSAGLGSEDRQEVSQGDLEGCWNPRPGKEEESNGHTSERETLRGQRFVGSDVWVRFPACLHPADRFEPVKSNLSTDIPPDQRISDEDILNNVNTVMFAGSDTSSLTLTWTLWLLAKNPGAQDRLREELSTVHCPDSFRDLSAEEIDSLYGSISELPYFDKVIKEALRLVPPVHSSIRAAGKDDEIPTSQPFKIRKPGGSVETVTMPIRVTKGTVVHIPIEAFNLDKFVWGQDAWEFKYGRLCYP